MPIFAEPGKKYLVNNIQRFWVFCFLKYVTFLIVTQILTNYPIVLVFDIKSSIDNFIVYIAQGII